MGLLPRIPASAARRLGWYVYLYVNPLTGSVFYVGKGKNNRALSHLKAEERRRIAKFIREIRAAGAEPRIEILAHGLPSEQVAHRVEGAAIDLLGLPRLANAVRGWKGRDYGRISLEELVARYTARRIRIKEPAVLIRINRSYRHGMTDIEVYDVTRSAWKVGRRRDDVDYALAVFEGVVREVYRITHWLPGGSTFNVTHSGKRVQRLGRWEFVGTLAPDPVRRRYVNGYVGHLFGRGSQNPVVYLNVDSARKPRRLTRR